MAGCALTTRTRVANSGDLTAIRKTPAGSLARASDRVAQLLLHRSSMMGACSSRWEKILSTETALRLFMRSVPMARGTLLRAGFSGLLAEWAEWLGRQSQRTVCYTLVTWAERCIASTRQPERTFGSTKPTELSGDASCSR